VRRFFLPNIDRNGRIARVIFGAVLIVGSLLLATTSVLAAIGLAVPGVFALYEARRGWCVMRACGIKTRM